MKYSVYQAPLCGEGFSALIFLGWIFLLTAMLGTYARSNIDYAKPLLSHTSKTAKYNHARSYFCPFCEDSDHVISDDSGLDFHTGDANW